MNVAVLLSGGVDSSVALALLSRQKGLALKAYYLKIWLEEELSFLGDCPWEDDLAYARATCERLGVPLEIVPLQSEYRAQIVEHALAELRRGRTPSPDIFCNSFLGDCPWEADLAYARATCERLGVPLEIVPLQSEYRVQIVEHALAELRRGRTPSPDIFCNQRIKFGAFYQRVAGECEQIASGHYARVEEAGGGFRLRRAPDPVKDQTYFLSNLSQTQLAHIRFPIGHLHKDQVRAHAAEFDLPAKNRKDSQGMCFLGKINYRDFVRFHLGEMRGDIVEQASGQKKGEHPGYWFYTIGQRHGLQLGGGPWYVIDKDIANNIVYIAHGSAPTRTGRRELVAEHIHWIAGAPEHIVLQVKLRHGPALTPCEVQMLAPDHAHVALSTPDPGIAPGQHAVFYDGDICLGGGVIA